MNHCFLLCGLVLLFSACQTTSLSQHRESKLIREEILRAYLKDVKKSDGINLKEAFLVAQSDLIFHDLDKRYRIKEPVMAFEDVTRWGIVFQPISKTWGEAIGQSRFIIVVDKNSGQTRSFFDS